MTGDVYSYEEEGERLAEMKALHQPIKSWWVANPEAVKDFGETFPSFWQDLKDWPHWRALKKLYMMDTEGSKEPAATEATTTAAPSTAAEVEGSSNEPVRKRKNRWGEAKKSRWGDSAAGGEGGDTDGSKKRRSRWSAEPAAPVALSQEQVQETLVLQMKLKQVNERLTTVVQDAARREADPNKSPSPPPKYDSTGKRVNTREVRMREQLDEERASIIEGMMRLNPAFQVPVDYVKKKPSRKLYIPIKDYPGYNFIGLIIGPRGNTQKRMERETGCKIAIRGKGSVKEGARRTRTADEDDDLHVYITGDSEAQVEAAAKEIDGLLKPVDDDENEHKQKQLRELALINGTLRDDEYCHICGEKGHRQFECPKRAAHKPVIEIRCLICGDSSHPTRDCSRRRGAQGQAQGAPQSAALDKEYLNFMAELGDAPPPPPPPGAGPQQDLPPGAPAGQPPPPLPPTDPSPPLPPSYGGSTTALAQPPPPASASPYGGAGMAGYPPPPPPAGVGYGSGSGTLGAYGSSSPQVSGDTLMTSFYFAAILSQSHSHWPHLSLSSLQPPPPQHQAYAGYGYQQQQQAPVQYGQQMQGQQLGYDQAAWAQYYAQMGYQYPGQQVQPPPPQPKHQQQSASQTPEELARLAAQWAAQNQVH
jgi:splicing factor 1